jgi:hypothetical protein
MNAGGCAVEQRRWTWLPHAAKRRALIFFQDMIGLHLPVLEEFKAAQDRRSRDIVVKQAWQDFARGLRISHQVGSWPLLVIIF